MAILMVMSIIKLYWHKCRPVPTSGHLVISILNSAWGMLPLLTAAGTIFKNGTAIWTEIVNGNVSANGTVVAEKLTHTRHPGPDN